MFLIKGDLIFVSANTDIVGDLGVPPPLSIRRVACEGSVGREEDGEEQRGTGSHYKPLVAIRV